MRDSQRQRVYDAEGIVRSMLDRAVEFDSPVVTVEGITLTLPPEAKFASVAGVQSYCDRVCELIDTTPVTVRERKGSSKAHYEPGGVIAVPDGRNRWAMREIVVLHELAHHVTRSRGGWVAAHGPEFVGNFIELAERVMAPEMGLLLRVVYGNENVRMTCEV